MKALELIPLGLTSETVVTTNSEKSAEVIVLVKTRKDRTTGGINL